MTKIVAPAVVQYGDQVSINGQPWIVKDVTGPDQIGTYDFYLVNGDAAKHEVVTDAVTLVL
jgi:hypothetical protein